MVDVQDAISEQSYGRRATNIGKSIAYHGRTNDPTPQKRMTMAYDLAVGRPRSSLSRSMDSRLPTWT